ncbi:MAG: DUF1573 domain-containing protein [Bacteroidota bacterium]|jgi:hypothetical protein
MTLFVLGISFSQPKLLLDKPEIDLGIIYSGMKKQGKIVLTNIGNDTLQIYSVQPSCGCTAVKQPKGFLLPFESDVAEVEFNSSGYHGKVEKHVSIITNDPLSQNVSIRLIADVTEELESTSHSTLIWLGNIGLGKTLVQQTSLKNISDHKIKIKNFTTSSSSISIIIEKKMLNPNDTLDVQMTIRPEKLGYATDNFTVETDSKNQSRVEMKVSYVCVKEN